MYQAEMNFWQCSWTVCTSWVHHFHLHKYQQLQACFNLFSEKGNKWLRKYIVIFLVLHLELSINRVEQQSAVAKKTGNTEHWNQLWDEEKNSALSVLNSKTLHPLSYLYTGGFSKSQLCSTWAALNCYRQNISNITAEHCNLPLVCCSNTSIA